MERKYKFYEIECDFCGHSIQTEPKPSIKDAPGGYDFLALKQEGWEIDEKRKLHFCPECAAKRKELKEKV